MTGHWPLQSQIALKAFYGDPDANGDGLPDPAWVADNITYITPPYSMVLAWDIARPIFRIAVHKKCAASLLSALQKIGERLPAETRQKYQLDRFGGCFNFRLKRAGHTLSCHAYGAAIDLAPELNPMGREYGSRANMMPMDVINIFESLGWVSGYHFDDCQHFQAATLS